MRIAIIGFRKFNISNFKNYIPEGIEVTEIISSGAKGVDKFAKIYAQENGVKFTEYLPEHKKYSRAAPLKRNIDIINNSDYVLIFWDGKSQGTKFIIDRCKEINKPHKIYVMD